ncbi:MAG: NADH-quinone oxidoreductase subunit J [Bdellovibrionales bacterium]|nr:NADH-quinone oxidoreductase subunit J [Bdellovibrionales bacterium]
MITWICCAVTLVSALISSWTHDIRRAILALWVCGLGMGGVALDLGSEFLAVTVWIISTTTTIGFVFYSVMFGEFRSESNDEDRKAIVKKVVGLVTVAVMGYFIYSGIENAIRYRESHRAPKVVELPAPSEPTEQKRPANDLLGDEMVSHHFLTLELLGFSLFLILVASGVIARPRRKGEPIP